MKITENAVRTFVLSAGYNAASHGGRVRAWGGVGVRDDDETINVHDVLQPS